MSNVSEIENAVTEFLVECGVSFSVQLVGATKRDEWECDEWRVTLRGARAEYVSQFFTGIGHRKMKKNAEAFRNGARPGTIAYADWQKRFSAPQAPHAASVLHSLVLDGQAVDMSFVDWCAEYGYDEDSRKALSTYEACCECGRKLRNLFNTAQRQKLAKIVQEY